MATPPPTPSDTSGTGLPYCVTAGRGRLTGLVFASAHSGSDYPQSMRPVVGYESLRTAEDAHVDRLITCAPEYGAALILCNAARAYVDLNRAEADLDPLMIRDCPPIGPSAKTVAGYGVIHRLSGDGRPLYDRWLTMQEVEERLAQVHRPYHAALSDLMHTAREMCGRAVLIDCHSMPARATGPHGPDIILGDRFGSSCDAYWTRRLRALFEAHGLRVGLNRPYAGGYATQLWGQPSEGFHAVQIEINRRLYWDETRHEPSAGWKRLHRLMGRVIEALCIEAEVHPEAAE